MKPDMVSVLTQFARPGMSLERFGQNLAALFVVSLVMSGRWVPR